MEDEVQQNEAGETAARQQPVKKRSKVGRVFSIGGVVLLVLILAVLIVNALLSMFKDNYYPTFGQYRLFSIVSDSMEPAIPKGSMIVAKKPTNVDDIVVSTSETSKDGTVITFRTTNAAGEKILLTHRVVGKTTDNNGNVRFDTRGDNAGGTDGVHPTWNDVVGIYTGKKCGFFGSLFGFFQSGLGTSVLIFFLFIVIVAWIAIAYINKNEERKALAAAALKKSSEALGTVNLRYDNIHEITAVMDVLGMVSETPRNRAEEKNVADRLNEFIRATSLELPQTRETAAILDSLPAPDTPGSLAAALSTGATLRQAEDGQTLILTTMSGGKNIFLTPVNTPDGIILCQQGVRIKTDIAPNVESMGISSMPAVPEFFEGQPLEKNVEYPELPGPDIRLGPEHLLNGDNAQALSRQLPSPEAIASSPSPVQQRALLPDAEQNAPSQSDELTHIPGRLSNNEAHLAYKQYRELSAQLEIKQAEQLSSLLTDTAPLTYEEQLRVAEYKAAHPKPKKPRKPVTDEQKIKRKEAAERRRIAQEAFLNTLTPEDRELYLTEQKLAKSRENAIRKLKRIAADRKLLEKIEE